MALESVEIDQDEFDIEWAEPGLGCDDYPPTHLLLVDKVESKMAIAPWKDGHKFLRDQYPPAATMTPEELAAAKAAVIAVMKALNEGRPPTMQEMNRKGMFERLTQPDPQLVQQSQQMAAFLDKHLDPAIREALNRFQADL